MHEIELIRNLRIPVGGGVTLSADVVRPTTPGRYPAVFEYHPYHKSSIAQPIARFGDYARRGYVMLSCDVLGTGDSGGVSTDAWSPAEVQAGCEAIEWIAAQPWCDGNVGMWGISYPAVLSFLVAAQNPPALKCILAAQCMDELYTDFIAPGGAPRLYQYEQYSPLMTVYNFAPPHPEYTGAEWSSLWDEHLRNNVPWGIGFISHLVDGPFWRERSVAQDYNDIKCPVFMVGGWADFYATNFLRAFSRLSGPKQALIGPWCHSWPDHALPGPQVDGIPLYMAWFDKWLKGIDGPNDDAPGLTIFVREYAPPSAVVLEEPGHFRSETAWPPARVQPRALHLHGDGHLAEAVPDIAAASFRYDAAVGVAAGRYVVGQFSPGFGLPGDQRADEMHSLSFTTARLTEPTELMGVPAVTLQVSSTAPVAYFSVKLCDVAPDGTSVLIAKGGLNGTHRAGHTAPQPMTPGEVYELQFELTAVAYRLEAGHCLRVNIAGADFLNAWPTPVPATHTVHCGGSHIVLPFAPPQEPALPPPPITVKTEPLPAREQLNLPRYSIARDLAAETTTVEYESGAGSGMNRSRYTVSSRDPAHASIDSSFVMEKHYPGRHIKMQSHCATTSDAQAFHHTVEVEITINESRHFNKSWRVSVPREGN